MNAARSPWHFPWAFDWWMQMCAYGALSKMALLALQGFARGLAKGELVYCGEEVSVYISSLSSSPSAARAIINPEEGTDRADFTTQRLSTLINDAKVRGGTLVLQSTNIFPMGASSKAERRKFLLKAGLQTGCDVGPCCLWALDWTAATFPRVGLIGDLWSPPVSGRRRGLPCCFQLGEKSAGILL